MEAFESLPLQSQTVQTIFETGVAYGLGKKCYAIGEYEATDPLYLIFNKIFADEDEL